MPNLNEPRLLILLRNAEKCFREVRNPFAQEELVKNEVTSDECFDLSMLIANCIDYYIGHQNEAVDEQFVKVLREEFGDELADLLQHQLSIKRTLARMEAKKSSQELEVQHFPFENEVAKE